MSVYRGQIWALDTGKRDRLQLFERNQFSKTLHTDSQQIRLIGGNSNVFAHNAQHVVFPCHPRTGHLAIAYGADNRRKSVGAILFDREHDLELLRRIPAMNDTLWRYRNGFWYAVFKFQPILLTFDAHFNQVASFHLKSTFLDEKTAETIDFEPEKGRSFAPRIISDFKLTDRHLFLTCQSYLHQFDLKTGSLRRLYTFRRESLKPAEGYPGLGFSPFAVTDSGRIFLVGNPDWGHDLWYADLPKE